MTSQNQDMLNACTSGDITALRRLFEAMDIRKGSEPVYISTPNEPPPINDLLEAAITNGNPGIVSLLLETYSGIQFFGGVITALLNHPDLAILEALYNYDNRIVNFEWDDQVTTFVTEACKQPPEKIAPLLHFLVEHDADLWTGGLPSQFAVHAALCGNQALDVIEAMIKKGGLVSRQAAEQAVLRERADVLEFFIRCGVEGERDDVQFLRTVAKETGNTNVMKLVDIWTRRWKDNTSRALFGRGLFGRGLRFGSIWRHIFG
ncbi:hypothetical protein K458DRAFT_416666 [Lentithecium fluviatile CBS 122367]|uniref:Ankyrin n=1 Tax=Lentithecium fluviatile CBS 122367 TaxID=1168545 RepID=A0A6G1J772_9PLEO|nr:hypothetical protein K458DRAFT_416666 [Lentithecium fluviatile CBS 122367]